MSTNEIGRLEQAVEEMGAGGVGALKCSSGNLPLAQLHYHSVITGVGVDSTLVVRTTVAQTFYNPFDEPIEATYIFPLEGDQAVIGCHMWCGERALAAQLKERGEARREYGSAIARGQRAALLEENRPESFSMKVGNIPPGEAVQMRMECVGSLPIVGNEWTLRLPLVIAPRYTSGIPLPRAAVEHGIAADTSTAPDASSVTPPIWLPGFASPVHLGIQVDFELGECVPTDMDSRSDWPKHLRSSLHAIVMDKKSEGPGVCSIRIVPGERINRDFLLRGSMQHAQANSSLVFESLSESTAKQSEDFTKVDRADSNTRSNFGKEEMGLFSLSVVPPPVSTQAPRDIVFLLDRSGSMSGWKIEAAKRGICRFIDTLSPEDRFQVAVFDDSVVWLSGGASGKKRKWMPGTDAMRFKAVRWLSNLESRGGTEMEAALQDCLRLFQEAEPHSKASASDQASITSRNRALLLVTDGQITGEDAVLRVLDKFEQAERPRIFCLGVDRAVNGSLLKRITNFTNGTFEVVESEKRLDEILDRFSLELGSPSVTDLKVRLANDDEKCDSSDSIACRATSEEEGKSSAEGIDLQIAPCPTALYAGRPVQVYGRVQRCEKLAVILSGKRSNGEPWEERLEARVQEVAKSCSNRLPMWGRARIRILEDRLIAEGMKDKELQADILKCSLESNTLSRLTAFVVVDESEVVNGSGKPHKIVQPVEMPSGWMWLPPIPVERLRSKPIAFKKWSISYPSSFTPKPVDGNIQQFLFTDEDIARELVANGLISPEQVSESLELAKRQSLKLLDALDKLQYCDGESLGKAVAKIYQSEFCDPLNMEFSEEAILSIPQSVARENNVYPIASDENGLTVAISDPSDIETFEKLRFILNRPISYVVASRESIRESINRHYGQIDGESADSMLQEFTDAQIDFTMTEDSPIVLSSPSAAHMDLHSDEFDGDISYGNAMQYDDVDDDLAEDVHMVGTSFGIQRPTASFVSESHGSYSTIVRLVDLLFNEAIQLQATYVFLEERETGISVSFVINGKVVERDTLPKRLGKPLRTRLLILAQLDITRSEAQSGRAIFQLLNSAIDAKIHVSGRAEDIKILIELHPDDSTIKLPSVIESRMSVFQSNLP